MSTQIFMMDETPSVDIETPPITLYDNEIFENNELVRNQLKCITQSLLYQTGHFMLLSVLLVFNIVWNFFLYKLFFRQTVSFLIM